MWHSQKKIEESVGYLTTLTKEAHKEKDDNPHMTAPHYLINHISSQR
jgi:hypothetical protein